MSWFCTGLVVGLLAVTPAFADMYPDASNAKLPDARTNLAIAPHVATNALLAAASTTAYPAGLWRDDYSAGLGAPPVWYRASGSACSLNAGNGDNGSQVKSADGKCWLAVFSAGGIDVREFGAVGNNTIDDTAAIQNSIDSLPPQGGTIAFPPNRTFKTTGTLTIGNGSAAAGSTISGVMLVGGGNPVGTTQFGPNNAGGPVINYTGSGDAIRIAGPLLGWGIEGLSIQCANSTGTVGLHVISGSYGDSRNLRIAGCQTQILSTTVAAMPAGYTIIDALHNNFKNVVLELTGANGVGIKLAANGLATANSDTDFTNFDDLTIYFASTTTGTAYGVILEVCDDNVFHNVHFTAAGTSATIKPYYFDYSVSNLFPSGNVIDITDPAMLGCGSLASGGCGTSDTGTVGHNFTNNGTPGAGSSANYLNNLQLTNGARYPLNLPNLLVDKAQAAWTPTFHGSTGGTPPSYSVGQQNGWVTEAGYDVTIYFNLTAPIAAPMTGDLLLTSLPVAVGSGNNEIAACVVVANGVVFSGGRSGVYLAPQAGTQQMAVGEFGGSGSAGSLPIADISGSGIALFGQCKYHR